MYFFPERQIFSTFEVLMCGWLVTFSDTKDQVSSLRSYSADLLGHHSRVCSCRVPPGCHGTVCIIQVEFHQAALAVRYICCCCLYQFRNHHAAESCKRLWHHFQ